MTEKMQYSYTILRYVHDVTTGEFINVGVVFFVPCIGLLKTKTRHTIGRIKSVFPDISREAFVSTMKSVERGMSLVATDLLDVKSLHPPGLDAAQLAKRTLPDDYSSLQWSAVGTGLTENPERTFERLYERFVARYDEHALRRRTDEDVWRPVRNLLEEKNIHVSFEKKEVVGKADIIFFERAWKNGVWHAYEPLSLDLADAEGIKDKARRWLGHLAAVTDGPSDEFKVYFLLGRPQSAELMPAFEKARAILAKAPGKPKIYDENQVEILVSQIEDEYRAHLN